MLIDAFAVNYQARKVQKSMNYMVFSEHNIRDLWVVKPGGHRESLQRNVLEPLRSGYPVKCVKHSDGLFQCRRVNRVVDALKYISTLDIANSEDDRKLFEHFMQETYTYIALLRDYSHIFKEHGDVEKLRNLVDFNSDEFPLHSFGVQNRKQFRARDYLQKIVVDSDDMSFWCDLLNIIHCHLFHHCDMGIRIKVIDRRITRNINMDQMDQLTKCNDSNFQLIDVFDIDSFQIYAFQSRRDICRHPRKQKIIVSPVPELSLHRPRGNHMNGNDVNGTSPTAVIDAAEFMKIHPISRMQKVGNQNTSSFHPCTMQMKGLMQENDVKQYIGQEVYLLLTNSVRYDGILDNINEETRFITLKHGM